MDFMSEYANNLLREPNFLLDKFDDNGNLKFDSADRLSLADGKLLSLVGEIPLQDKIIIEIATPMKRIKNSPIKAVNVEHALSLELEKTKCVVVAISKYEKDLNVGDTCTCRFTAGEPVRMDLGKYNIPCLIMYRMSILTMCPKDTNDA